ncbi:GNAT family N-acetyltransferase [Cellulophaga sp. HaHaR_3_176]|uniref:GNAT family N-acetyltransferase n=1 Tax=Cellulophaga sp. HaHaR_3_176 TaxID=1942464 RepID=UPI001C1F9D8E|nr:GNAT family N-acetyltransferase [Cellulophaga sp. HaHaR_3_176]QWX82554.1 GNAT family N-acetyltransferase [Cellulophaga sp. HaHaR_3_176]
MKIIKTDYNNKDYKALVVELDADLAIKDGEDHSFYNQFNSSEGINNVIVIYKNDIAVGCGAIKPFNRGTVEIKRMFVKPEHQGKGLGSLILKALEDWAKLLNYSACVLETGIRQPDAIALYKKNGYLIIENYGQYIGVENSICFKKNI